MNFKKLAALAVLALTTAVPAFAQSDALRQQKETEYRTMFVAKRALSTCPHLVEDWEYEVVSSTLSTIERQLTNGGYFNPEVKRQLIGQVEALTCDDPNVVQESKRFRTYAHQYWIAAADAWMNTSVCSPPSGDDLRFLKALRSRILDAHQSKGGLPALDEDWIDFTTPEMGAEMRRACQQNGGTPKLLSEAWYMQMNVIDVLNDAELLTSPDISRNRFFNFDQGFTIGVGETIGMTWPRHSDVVARRDPVSTRRIVRMRNSACGGRPETPVAYTFSDAGQTKQFDDRVDCVAEIRADGTIVLKARWENADVNLASARIQILAADGSVQVDQQAVVETASHFTSATATFQNPMEVIRQGAGTANQVHFKLGFEIAGQLVDEVILHDSNVSGINTVAAIDVIRAYDFAFSDQTDDLIWNGLAVQAAKDSGLID